MKTKLITAIALSALTLSPALGATKKMTAASDARSKSKSKTSAAASTKSKGAELPGKQAGARELAADLTTTQRSRMLTLLNKGTASELTVIKGVSKTRAAAIAKARPFKKIDEVILVSGVGKGTFSEIIAHARSLTTRTKKPASSSSKKPASASPASKKRSKQVKS